MSTLLVIIFAITLVYLSIIERFKHYVKLLAAQGIILFLISVVELHKIDVSSLILITAETLFFKTLLVPLLMNNILKSTKLEKIHKNAMPGIYSIMFISLGIVLSILISYVLQQKGISSIFFTIGIMTTFTGMFLVITRKKIFSHMVGFLVLENAVFLISLAVGSEMPVYINIGILLDIFVSVLILGIFIMRIGARLNDIEADKLSHLKD